MREWVEENFGLRDLIRPTMAILGEESKSSRTLLRHMLVGRKRPSVTTAGRIEEATGIPAKEWGDDHEV